MMTYRPAGFKEQAKVHNVWSLLQPTAAALALHIRYLCCSRGESWQHVQLVLSIGHLNPLQCITSPALPLLCGFRITRQLTDAIPDI
jgi:hypothetical protein